MPFDHTAVLTQQGVKHLSNVDGIISNAYRLRLCGNMASVCREFETARLSEVQPQIDGLLRAGGIVR